VLSEELDAGTCTKPDNFIESAARFPLFTGEPLVSRPSACRYGPAALASSSRMYYMVCHQHSPASMARDTAQPCLFCRGHRRSEEKLLQNRRRNDTHYLMPPDRNRSLPDKDLWQHSSSLSYSAHAPLTLVPLPHRLTYVAGGCTSVKARHRG
jgi:hypothetical protein